jgi:hypothetical protein
MNLLHIIHKYHVWEGYLRKIPVERRKISRAEWNKQYTNKQFAEIRLVHKY